MKHRALLIVLALAAGTAVAAWAAVPTTLDDFYMPGSQPCETTDIQAVEVCAECHAGYNVTMEAMYHWRGSMMSHAARDPVFLAALAVANQDAPYAGELCLRCHAPAGWLAGRAVADGSALESNDVEGVQCGVCHRMVKPAVQGSNPYWLDPAYTYTTYPIDQDLLGSIVSPPPASANGMMVLDSRLARRGPFLDATPDHAMLYSPFHRDANACGTCHDMSNPLLSRQPDGTYAFNAFGARSTNFSPYAMKALERTATEWTWSAFNTAAGVEAPQFGGNRTTVSSCQDCHLRDISGVASVARPAVFRNDLPLHDMTGGNTVTGALVAHLRPGEVDLAAVAAGAERARQMLQKAATLALTVRPQDDQWVARVRIVNQTGHKLPTGFPEGRRMWIHLVATDGAGHVVYESGVYDAASATLVPDAALRTYEHLNGLSATAAAATGLPAGRSYHTVLNDVTLRDNRLPPRGYRNAEARDLQIQPVGVTYGDGQNWDEVEYVLPLGATQVTATLRYQGLTREYVEFLRDANVTNDAGDQLYAAWSATGRAAPETMAQASVVVAPTMDRQPPAKPLGVAAHALSASTIALSWQPSMDDFGVAGYRVYRDGMQVFQVTETALQDFGLKPRTTYAYEVVAYDATGNASEPSDVVRATTKPGLGRGGGIGRALEPALVTLPVTDDGVVSFGCVLPEGGDVLLQVIDVSGRVVGRCSERVAAGENILRWTAAELPRGLYFARLTHAGGVLTTRFIVSH